uniref:Subtilisin inhibitor domain-containing protein n=1 Tax=Rhizochromulina marina TaxID=1034831 RepID=A0A7S2R9S2_9STRA|mmetsp:Transcript_13187/g.38294  ORF Transcript_13187/g.38294 Transcript_13187/m.38294 type:complete len:119 (+) Transcript_13187:38-394(+)|eukprot:CAMPEP_0118973230 /NCGR_PEP_ID=MMETSP1173-20130426/9384_1 /TAXON_ID=1034831 /ORGANISM="Rhizochromulina marina cf, Strain CCMP1243" /LENGTH=118 /DNA_ID=CAMNT_0006922847 /DNA_START=20 /DNA_END=376 /DNA_ORIENTATION=-
MVRLIGLVLVLLAATAATAQLFSSQEVRGRRDPSLDKKQFLERMGRPSKEANKARVERWKHFVGLPAEEVKAKIMAEDGSLHVQIVQENSPVTMDYRLDRVRLVVDKNGLLSRPPKTG